MSTITAPINTIPPEPALLIFCFFILIVGYRLRYHLIDGVVFLIAFVVFYPILFVPFVVIRFLFKLHNKSAVYLARFVLIITGIAGIAAVVLNIFLWVPFSDFFDAFMKGVSALACFVLIMRVLACGGDALLCPKRSKYARRVCLALVAVVLSTVVVCLLFF